MRAELERRASLEDQLYGFILAHPRVWLRACDMRPVAGDAWRSRLVQVRARLSVLGYTFDWNKRNGGAAAYRLRAQPLGRESTQPVQQQGLF
jgi:hypothetical protein